MYKRENHRRYRRALSWPDNSGGRQAVDGPKNKIQEREKTHRCNTDSRFARLRKFDNRKLTLLASVICIQKTKIKIVELRYIYMLQLKPEIRSVTGVD